MERANDDGAPLGAAGAPLEDALAQELGRSLQDELSMLLARAQELDSLLRRDGVPPPIAEDATVGDPVDRLAEVLAMAEQSSKSLVSSLITAERLAGELNH